MKAGFFLFSLNWLLSPMSGFVILVKLWRYNRLWNRLCEILSSPDKLRRARTSISKHVKHPHKSTASKQTADWVGSWSLLSPPACISSFVPLSGKTSFCFCLFHYHVCKKSCRVPLRRRTRPSVSGEETRAPGQVHDIHYRWDYNERHGNGSRPCLYIDIFKPWTIDSSHTRVSFFFFLRRRTNEIIVHPIRLAWCHIDCITHGGKKSDWIKADGRISVGMQLRVCMKILFLPVLRIPSLCCEGIGET